MNVLSLSSLLLVAVILSACSSPRPEPRPGTVSINTGGFGPNIQISGIDDDDDTPARVSID